MTIESFTVATPPSKAFLQLCGWENLLLAASRAARGKHAQETVARFEFNLADNLLELQAQLRALRWRPGGYRSFYIHEPKRRLISAAPFADRIVHHALLNIIEPRFEERFSPASFANRRNKGTHRAIDRVQVLARRYRYALCMDVVQHFPSIDHALLLRLLNRWIAELEIRVICQRIVESGCDLFDATASVFDGDDLFSACRPRGLPIGNLTSQFWSNCYLHPLDQFIERELRPDGYARYVDDLVLFANDKPGLWSYRRQIIARLQRMRLRVHETRAHPTPVGHGVPWLGFIIYPGYRRLQARKLRHATRTLRADFRRCRRGEGDWVSLRRRIAAWVAHARYATGDGARRAVLARITR